MKRQLLLLTSFCCLTAMISNAQTSILNQTTLQGSANFNIDGTGMAKTFKTSSTTGAGGTGHYLITENALNRWALGTANVENGTTNQGSDFALYAYKNDGSFIARYLTVLRSSGFMGINTVAPTAQLHVNSAPTLTLAKFTYSNVPENDARLTIGNATGADGSYIPNIIARAYSPGRSFGLVVTAETEDIIAPTQEPYAAAILLDARSKTPARLNNANVLAVNSYGASLLLIKANGNVGIGTTAPGTNKLAVEGTIAARRIKVTQATTWPDYVFEEDYKLPSLQKIAAFIRANKHLPEVPSAKEIAENGQDIGEMNAILLKKVEELTLHMIAMEQEIAELKKKK